MSEKTQAVTDEPQAGADTPTQETDSPAQAAAGEATENEPQNKQSIEDLPGWAQEVISGLRKENASHRKAKQEAEAQAAKAEEERLAKQQEWQQLAEKRQARISELEPTADLAQKLTEMVTAQIQNEVKDWPEEVKALLPDEPTDVLLFAQSVEKTRPLAQKLAQTAPAPGNSRGPKPAAPAGKVEQERELQVQAKRFVRRNF